MSIASQVLDFYDDSQHELMSKFAMPSALRDVQTNILTPEQHSALPDADFGLIVLTKRAAVLRKYPVNDPGNAWLSSQYFGSSHEKLAFPARFIAAKFIKKACDAYAVTTHPRVEAYAARVEDGEADTNVFSENTTSSWMLRKLAQREFMSKQASAAEIDAMTEMPNEHFALVIRQEDGSIMRKYAMPDATHVRKAAAYFDKYAMQLQPVHRHNFAAAVQARAEDFQVDVSDHDALQKWASPSWNRHVNAHLEQRRSLLPRNQDAHGILDKLAQAIGQVETRDMADALQQFDEATGLDRYYDRGLADPYSSVMAKNAEGWSAEIGGRTLTEGDLKKVAESSKLAGYLGATFARQFKDHPVEIFESLPAPEKSLIGQIASGEA